MENRARVEFQHRKILLTVIHIVFLLMGASGISAMYFNSNYGRGITWVYDQTYEESGRFTAQLDADVEKIFAYVSYRDMFETDGKLDMDKVIIWYTQGPDPSMTNVQMTLGNLVSDVKKRGYYLDENFVVQGIPTSMENEDEEVQIRWAAGDPELLGIDPENSRMTLEELELNVLDHLGDYYSIYYNYIENKTNLHFKIVYTSGSGNEIVYTNQPDLTLEKARTCGRYFYVPGDSIKIESNFSSVPVSVAPSLEMQNPYPTNKYYMLLAIDTSYPNQDAYAKEATQYRMIRDNFIAGMVCVVLGIAGCVGSLILLMMASGHATAGSTKVQLYPADQIATEVGLLVWAAAAAGGLMLGKVLGHRLISFFFKEDQWSYWIKLMRVLIIYGISAVCLFSVVRRYKAQTLWTNSLANRAVHAILSYTAKARAAVGMGLAYLGVLSVDCVIFWGIVKCRVSSESTFRQWSIFLGLLAVFLVFNLFIYNRLFVKADQMDRIDAAIRNISQGDTSLQVDLSYLSGRELGMGEHINNIRSGLDTALKEKVKSERLKADLITNVSHDIKTPLTSIINYVDLIKRQNVQDPKVQEYLEVLEQKSQRLKTLTEDLVEASKASSGNLKLDMTDIDLVELVQQTNGEFEEKLGLRHLEIVASFPQEPVVIRADGRRMYSDMQQILHGTDRFFCAPVHIGIP